MEAQASYETQGLRAIYYAGNHMSEVIVTGDGGITRPAHFSHATEGLPDGLPPSRWSSDSSDTSDSFDMTNFSAGCGEDVGSPTQQPSLDLNFRLGGTDQRSLDLNFRLGGSPNMTEYQATAAQNIYPESLDWSLHDDATLSPFAEVRNRMSGTLSESQHEYANQAYPGNANDQNTCEDTHAASDNDGHGGSSNKRPASISEVLSFLTAQDTRKFGVMVHYNGPIFANKGAYTTVMLPYMAVSAGQRYLDPNSAAKKYKYITNEEAYAALILALEDHIESICVLDEDDAASLYKVRSTIVVWSNPPFSTFPPSTVVTAKNVQSALDMIRTRNATDVLRVAVRKARVGPPFVQATGEGHRSGPSGGQFPTRDNMKDPNHRGMAPTTQQPEASGSHQQRGMWKHQRNLAHLEATFAGSHQEHEKSKHHAKSAHLDAFRISWPARKVHEPPKVYRPDPAIMGESSTRYHPLGQMGRVKQWVHAVSPPSGPERAQEVKEFYESLYSAPDSAQLSHAAREPVSTARLFPEEEYVSDVLYPNEKSKSFLDHAAEKYPIGLHPANFGLNWGMGFSV